LQGLKLDVKIRDPLLVPHAEGNEGGTSSDVHRFGPGTQQVKVTGRRHVGVNTDVGANTLNTFREEQRLVEAER
jgi:hypothetical protein